MRDYVRRPPFAVATVAQRGAWVSLYSAAAEVEKGGKLLDCAAYDDRRWLALALVTRAEVDDAVAAGLARWEGVDLIVDGYDLDGERKIQAARENGKSGGRPRKTDPKPSGKPKKNRAVSSGVTQEEPKPNPSSESESGSESGSEAEAVSQESPPGDAPSGAKVLVARFCARWKNKYGVRYMPMPKDTLAVSRLLKTHPVGISEWETLCDRYLSDSSDFHAYRRHPLEHLANHPNAFRGNSPARTHRAHTFGYAPAVDQPREAGEQRMRRPT